MEAQTLREAVTSAIRYWEPRRFIYNIALTVVVLACFGLNYPASKSTISLDFRTSGVFVGGAGQRGLLRRLRG